MGAFSWDWQTIIKLTSQACGTNPSGTRPGSPNRGARTGRDSARSPTAFSPDTVSGSVMRISTTVEKVLLECVEGLIPLWTP